mmetsp:Transcript_85177/g.214800  ORF Transcript_85177/g.214800 Transcript_85177/m.214800 type:complete len:504 (-) Transcript_85177:224-1735(-)
MARIQDRAGSALGKHGYKQIKKIGEGSFGAAILVQHERDREKDPKAIVKMIDISRASRQEKEDAVKESKVLASLKHPYIVRYRESFHEDGWLCIVMDYCEGGDLSEKIKKMRQSGRTFAQEQILRWFTQAMLALKYVHDMHILHRDLKSGNFFLSKSGNLKMGDFGIAKVLECTAACAQTQIGTPYYLSPEICQGKPYAWGSDIWSMGCILYEMCARRVPFDAPDLKGLIQRITRGSAPEAPAEYSSGLRSLIKEMLDRDAGRRPNAAEVLKRPVVQEVVKKMLDEVKTEDDDSAAPRRSERGSEGGSAPSNQPAARRPSSAAGQRGSADAAGTYVKNQNVEYWSETHGEWLPASVTNADPDGRIMLNVKPNVWLSMEVQSARVRPRQQDQRDGRDGRARPPAHPGRAEAEREQPKRPPSGVRDLARQPSRDRIEARPSAREGGHRVPSPRRELGGGGGMHRVPSHDRPVHGHGHHGHHGGGGRKAPSPHRAAGVPSRGGSVA